MGSGNSDYRNQIDTALQQANQPKSDFAKQFTGMFQGSALNPVMNGLLNAGQLGNAFPGFMSGASTPGQVFNGGGFQPGQQFQMPPANIGNQPSTGVGTYQPTGNMANANMVAQNAPQIGGVSNPNQTIGNPQSMPGVSGLGYFDQQGISLTPELKQQQTAWKNALNQFNSTQDSVGSNMSPDEWNDYQIANHITKPPTSFSGWLSAQGYNAPSPNSQLLNNGSVQFQWPAQQGQYGQGYTPQQSSGFDPNSLGFNTGAATQQTPMITLQNGILSNGMPSGNTNGINGVQQANPMFQQMNMNGPNASLLGQLAQQFQSPGVGNYNPSSALMGSGLANAQYGGMQGLGLNGISQALQSQMFGSPFQAAAPQNVNPGNASLNLVGNTNTGAQQANAAQANIDQSAINPQDSQFYQGVVNQLQNQFNLGRADLRARFSASGGASRGTPAAFAEAQYDAQALPQMQQALGAARQQEFTNQLAQRQLGQEGNLQNAQMANQANLQNSMLGTNVNLQNVSNLLQAANQNNNSLLQARQQDIGNSQQNVSNMLQATGLNNNASTDRLNALSNLYLGNNNQQLQNYFNTIGANQNQLSILGGLANQAGNLNLGQNQLSSNNILNTNQLNSQNTNNALSQILGYQSNNNQNALGQNQILNNLSQFNAGQNNTMLSQMFQQAQAANQQQIQNQFTGLQNIAQIAAQLGLAGYPGGSANVNLGGQSQSWLQQLGGLL